MALNFRHVKQIRESYSFACPNRMRRLHTKQNRIKVTLCREIRVSYQYHYHCSHNIHNLCSSTTNSVRTYNINMVNFVHASFLLLLAITDGSTVSAATAKRTVCFYIFVLYISLSILSYHIVIVFFSHIHTVDLLPFALHPFRRKTDNQTGHGTTGEAVRDAQTTLPIDRYEEVSFCEHIMCSFLPTCVHILNVYA